jgi:hypothetical protein
MQSLDSSNRQEDLDTSVGGQSEASTPGLLRVSRVLLDLMLLKMIHAAIFFLFFRRHCRLLRLLRLRLLPSSSVRVLSLSSFLLFKRLLSSHFCFLPQKSASHQARDGYINRSLG